MIVTRLGVVGAGQMGQGIAQVAASAGLDVIVVDAAPDFAQAGIGKIKKQLDRLVDKAKLEADVRTAMLSHLKAGGGHRDLGECDVVIEAAPEKEELKLARKKAANIAMFWGGVAFCLGAVICLIYLWVVKPYKLH